MSRDTEDVPVTGADLEPGYGGFPLIEVDDSAERDVNFFNDWVQHPLPDDYWSKIDGDERWRDIASPVLFMAGWFDPFLISQLRDFTRIRSSGQPSAAAKSRLIIGPWAHAYTPTQPDGSKPDNFRLASITQSLPWFNLHLKGSVRSQDPSVVKLFVMGENVWRNEDEWPLARTVYSPYYLTESPTNSLATKPHDRSSKISYDSDPHNPVPSRGGAMLGPRAGPRLQDLKPRPDVIAFDTDPLSLPIEITGPIKVVLFVQTDADSTDFVATLMDVHPSGRAFKISDGIIRRNYERMSVKRIEIEMWPTSILVAAGHKLRLHISSSSYPRFDVNPNTGRDISTEASPIVAHQSIFLGGSTPSHLLLPIIPR
jgi:putative CocE/NonD family hydrolase